MEGVQLRRERYSQSAVYVVVAGAAAVAPAAHRSSVDIISVCPDLLAGREMADAHYDILCMYYGFSDEHDPELSRTISEVHMKGSGVAALVEDAKYGGPRIQHTARAIKYTLNSYPSANMSILSEKWSSKK